jgi:LysR family hydrogen peroxide-inducible transcriptional activator
MRSQIMHLCELKMQRQEDNNFHYEAGSLETLKKMVETNTGITILPALARQGLSAQQLKMVRHFKAPVPVREVSLATHRTLVKKRLLDVLREELLLAVPQEMQYKNRYAVVTLCMSIGGHVITP